MTTKNGILGNVIAWSKKMNIIFSTISIPLFLAILSVRMGFTESTQAERQKTKQIKVDVLALVTVTSWQVWPAFKVLSIKKKNKREETGGLG